MAVSECPDGHEGTAQVVKSRGYRPATTHGNGSRDAAGWNYFALSGQCHSERSGNSAETSSGEEARHQEGREDQGAVCTVCGRLRDPGGLERAAGGRGQALGRAIPVSTRG